MPLINTVKPYSASIGNNPMLIQGAGGNVSWKEGNVLWVKASGTCLADAESKDIFVPLNLQIVRQLIRAGTSDYTPACLFSSTLRPSIETSLHALLPQPVVVHVHAIDIIAKAVLRDAKTRLAECLTGLNWLWIDYVTPGIKLTQKIAERLNDALPPDIIVLGNHGLVIAGDSVEQVDALLQNLLMKCKVTPRMSTLPGDAVLNRLSAEWAETGYVVPENTQYHTLCIDPVSLDFTRHKWVMYPDHVIFLGGHAVFKNHLLPRSFLLANSAQPPCIFIAGQGMVVRKDLSRSQHAMLQCYADVVSRLPDPLQVNALHSTEINELINWDAEKYRQTMNIS